jgi:hypothetical protein
MGEVGLTKPRRKNRIAEADGAGVVTVVGANVRDDFRPVATASAPVESWTWWKAAALTPQLDE